MDENDILRIMGIIAILVCFWMLFILAGSIDPARTVELTLLSSFAGLLAILFFSLCD